MNSALVQMLPLEFSLPLVLSAGLVLALLAIRVWTRRIAHQASRNEAASGKLVSRLESRIRHLQREKQQVTRNLDALLNAAQQISTERTIDGVVGITLETVWQSPDVDFVAILLGDDELGPFRYVGFRGIECAESYLGNECQVPLWGTLAEALVSQSESEQRRFLLIEDVEQRDLSPNEEFPWAPEGGTLMILPFRSMKRTLGAVIVGSHRPGRLSNSDLQGFLCTIADIGARALHDGHSRERSGRWMRQLVGLQLLSKNILESRTIDQLLNTLESEVRDMFDGAGFSLFLDSTSASPDLIHAFANDIHEAPAPEGKDSLLQLNRRKTGRELNLILKFSELYNLIRWSMAEEQPVFFDLAHPPEAVDLFRESGPALIVPICFEGPLAIGAVLIYAQDARTSFDEDDLIVLRTAVNVSVLAFEKALPGIAMAQDPMER